MSDEKRNDALLFEYNKILLDLSHEKINEKTLDLFEQLAKDANIYKRIEEMFTGVIYFHYFLIKILAISIKFYLKILH